MKNILLIFLAIFLLVMATSSRAVQLGSSGSSFPEKVPGSFEVTGQTTFNSQAYTWPALQGGNNTFLKNSGTGVLTWEGVSATPGGATGAVQFNSSGVLSGEATNLFFDKTNRRLGVGTGAPTATLEVVGDLVLTGTGNSTVGGDLAIGAAGASIEAATGKYYGDGSALTNITPSGAAGGDLTGTYPNPTIAAGAVSLTTDVSGILPIANGGTNKNTWTAYSLAVATGTNVLGETGVGTSGAVLKGITGAVPVWGQVSLASDMTGVLPVANGGTNVGTYPAAMGIVYATTTSSLTATAQGTAGHLLESNGAAAPGWTSMYYPESYTLRGLIFATSATSLAATAAGTSGAVLKGVTSGTPVWGQVSLTSDMTGILPIANGGTNKSSWTQYAVLYADTTTSLAQLALGTTTQVLHGNASGAPSWGSVSLTADMSGVLPVTSGGTSVAVFPAAMGIVYATTTTSLTATAQGTVGHLLESNGAAAPGWTATYIPDSYTSKGLIFATSATSFAATAAGTSGAVLKGVTSGTPVWGQVSLTTDMTGILPIANGGTNKSSWTQYAVLYADTTTSLAQLALGTTTQVLHGNASGAPSWGSVSLTADMSGVLPVTSGGTSVAVFPAAMGIVYATTTTSLTATAQGTVGHLLESNGAAAPGWTSMYYPESYTLRGLVFATSATSFAATAAGTSGAVLKGVTSGTPVWGQVSLTSDMTGILPIANGGTNASTFAAGAVIFYKSSTSALSGEATNLFYDVTNKRLGVGTTGPVSPLDIVGISNTVGSVRITTSNVTDASWIDLVTPGIGIVGQITNNHGVNFNSDYDVSMVVGGSGYGFKVWNPAATTQYLTIPANTGNVGIGTGTPEAKLDIRTGALATKGVIVQAAASQTADLTQWRNSSGTTISSVDASGNFKFGGGASTEASTGNIWAANYYGNGAELTGVSAVPGGATGAVQFNSSGVLSGEATNLFYDATNKRLGVGTATPDNTIQVKDLIDFNNSTHYGTYLGYEAGKATLASPTYNTAIGGQALRYNTSGSRNAAAGFQSLYTNSTGYRNSAMGMYSLYYNSTGYFNTATGYQALFGNTTGANNTASGYQALYNAFASNNTAYGSQALYINSTGANNTATGFRALYLNSSGGNNVANGMEALKANDSGSNNTATGYQSLIKNTTGSRNTATGQQSLYTNTVGIRNTANGMYSLYSNTGSQNTAYGYNTLFVNTTGNNNIAIGYAAGDDVTTGSNNIVIGYNIHAPSATASNQMSIGNLIFATGVNTGAGTTVSNGMVGIKNNAPAHVLDVTGGFSATGADVDLTGLGSGTGTALILTAGNRVVKLSSSKRYKHDIKNYELDTADIGKLNPVRFTWNSDTGTPDKEDFGLIAEDVQKVFPELVAYNSKGQIESVDYAKLSVVLLKAVQEQNKLISSQNKTGRCVAITTKTTDYTVAASDEAVMCNSLFPFTVTLPAATGSGRNIIVKNINLGAITVAGAGADRIDGAVNKMFGQWQGATIADYASGAWVILY